MGKRWLLTPETLFRDRFIIDFPGIGKLEVYPNRDSISYIDIYGIPEVSTMYRGTFRYPGWCETLDLMKQLRMLDDISADYSNMSFSGFLAVQADLGNDNLKTAIAEKFRLTDDSAALHSLIFWDSSVMKI